MNMKCAELDHLFDAIQTLSEKDEFYAFFQDLCTIDELHEMGSDLKLPVYWTVAKIMTPSVNQQALVQAQYHESKELINTALADINLQLNASINFTE